jgi:hypothetical protein
MSTEMTFPELARTVIDSLYFFTAFIGGVFIGYLMGYRDGNDNF